MLLGPARGSIQPRSLKRIAVRELHDPERITKCLMAEKKCDALPEAVPMTDVIVKDSWSSRHNENIVEKYNR